MTLTREISPHDRLEWYDLCFLDKNRTAFQLFLLLVHLLGHLFDPRRHDMVWDDVFEFVEPV